jgi:protein TonB
MSIRKFTIQQWDLQKTVLISLLVHALLLLLFLVLKVGATIELPEFIQVQFASSFVRPVEQPVARKTEPPDEPPRQEPGIVEEEIELPPRRMLEKEPPELTIPQSTKSLPAKQIPVKTERVKRPATRPEVRPSTATAPRAVEPLLPRNLPAKPTAGLDRASPRGTVEAFEIEGKAAERTILKKILPRYPEGYNREGTVRIRFTVLPNGYVGEMIPVLKTDAVLERTAMEVLAKWRFNPLPKGAPPDTVEGIITFRFRLK